MNRQEFEELELQVQQSNLPLKSHLQQIGETLPTIATETIRFIVTVAIVVYKGLITVVWPNAYVFMSVSFIN